MGGVSSRSVVHEAAVEHAAPITLESEVIFPSSLVLSMYLTSFLSAHLVLPV